ncbi:MAG: hypothetical protein EXX96DRAFT_547755 [Benjaminiella poitrasii]|nr:MAG: hypothetical protein EXX96DRAFT_547755 [Benjaminiella poitrasii]
MVSSTTSTGKTEVTGSPLFPDYSSYWETSSNKQEVQSNEPTAFYPDSTTATLEDGAYNPSPSLIEQQPQQQQQGSDTNTIMSTMSYIHQFTAIFLWLRFAFRVLQSLASFLAFGFQAGANSHSGEPVPFEHKGLLYCGFMVCWLSICWSLFNTVFTLCSFSRERRVRWVMQLLFGKRQEKDLKGFLPILFDLVMAGLFGVCYFYEINTYHCELELHNGWCRYYRTGLYFLLFLFIIYLTQATLDIITQSISFCLKRKRKV